MKTYLPVSSPSAITTRKVIPQEEEATITVKESEWEQAQSKIKEFQDKWMRSMADIENVRTRAKAETQTAKSYGAQPLAKDFLGVVDNLELALNDVNTRISELNTESAEGQALKNLIDGLTLTHKDMLSVFEKHHVKKVGGNGLA